LLVPELDMQLARLMETGRTSVVDFTVNLIRRCVLDEEPSATQNDFFNSIEVLNKLAQRGKAPERYYFLSFSSFFLSFDLSPDFSAIQYFISIIFFGLFHSFCILGFSISFFLISYCFYFLFLSFFSITLSQC